MQKWAFCFRIIEQINFITLVTSFVYIRDLLMTPCERLRSFKIQPTIPLSEILAMKLCGLYCSVCITGMFIDRRDLNEAEAFPSVFVNLIFFKTCFQHETALFTSAEFVMKTRYVGMD